MLAAINLYDAENECLLLKATLITNVRLIKKYSIMKYFIYSRLAELATNNNRN